MRRQGWGMLLGTVSVVVGGMLIGGLSGEEKPSCSGEVTELKALVEKLVQRVGVLEKRIVELESRGVPEPLVDRVAEETGESGVRQEWGEERAGEDWRGRALRSYPFNGSRVYVLPLSQTKLK